VCGQCHAQAAVPPGKEPVSIRLEAKWAPAPVWTGMENLAPHWDLIPRPSSPWQVTIMTALSQPTFSGSSGRMRKYTKTQVLQREYVALETEGTLRFSRVGEKKYFQAVLSSYQSSWLNVQGCQESESSC